jgi:copper resistance protein C
MYRVTTGRGRGFSRRAFAVAAGLLIGLPLPALVAAHADLVSSDPADGAVLTEPPAEVVITFSEALVGESAFSVLDVDGATLATGGPDPADPTVMRATLPTLGAGMYTVQWTSVAEDGDVLRGTFTFSYAVPAPPVPTPTATEGPSIAPGPTPAPTPPASPSPTPAPSAAGDDGGTDGGSDVLVAIVVAALLVAGGLAFFLRRRTAA